MLTNSESGIINERNQNDSMIYNNNNENIINEKKNIWEDLKRTLTTFSHDCKNLLIDIGLPIHREHIAMITSVEPICSVQDMPLCYRDGKCYHQIKTADGMVFKLIFMNLDFETICQHLRPNRVVKISYKDPNFRVINIFPQRLYRILSYERFMEEYNPTINRKTLVRICSLDNNIVKVEFLEHDITKVSADNGGSDPDEKTESEVESVVNNEEEEEESKTDLNFDEDEPIAVVGIKNNNEPPAEIKEDLKASIEHPDLLCY